MTTREQEKELKIIKAPNRVQYRIMSAVTKVPKGKVTSYGHIAMLVGKAKTYSRVVGQDLNNCKLIIKQLNETLDDDSKKIDYDSFPWHRILGNDGTLRGERSRCTRQKDLIEKEGIEFVGSGPKKHVDMKEYGWFPEKIKFTDVKDEEVDFDKK